MPEVIISGKVAASKKCKEEKKKTPFKQTNQLTLIQALYEIRYLTKSIFKDQMMCILTVADLPHVKQQNVLIDWLQQQDRVFRDNEKKYFVDIGR